jgi:hypothetical protein
VRPHQPHKRAQGARSEQQGGQTGLGGSVGPGQRQPASLAVRTFDHQLDAVTPFAMQHPNDLPVQRMMARCDANPFALARMIGRILKPDCRGTAMR